jgi:hypothetical protein
VATYLANRWLLHLDQVPIDGRIVLLKDNRTLMERVRAMLLESGLPKQMWAEALATAKYVRNRSPAATVSRTPFETFYGKVPNVSGMRVFSTAFAWCPDDKPRKLDAKSCICSLIGYEGAGYRLWPHTKKVLVHRCDL